MERRKEEEDSKAWELSVTLEETTSNYSLIKELEYLYLQYHSPALNNKYRLVLTFSTRLTYICTAIDMTQLPSSFPFPAVLVASK